MYDMGTTVVWWLGMGESGRIEGTIIGSENTNPRSVIDGVETMGLIAKKTFEEFNPPYHTNTLGILPPCFLETWIISGSAD